MFKKSPKLFGLFVKIGIFCKTTEGSGPYGSGFLVPLSTVRTGLSCSGVSVPLSTELSYINDREVGAGGEVKSVSFEQVLTISAHGPCS